MVERYVIANCLSGISNRIKCLISAMRIADESSAQLLLYWPQDHAVNCGFHDLFSTDIQEIDTQELDSLRHGPDASACRILTTWRLETLPGDRLPKRFSRALPSDTGRHIDQEYQRIPADVRDAILRYVRMLTPVPEIVERVDAYAERLGGDAMGLSVRSWPEDRERAGLFDISHVYAIIDGSDEEGVFLSCDDQKVVDEIIARYGERIHLYPRATPAGDRYSRQGMQEIMVELLLLGQCKRLWVPHLSTFPEMAWWFGDCQAEVSVIPPKSYLFRRTRVSRSTVGYSVFWRWHLTFDATERLRLLKRQLARLAGRP